MSRQGSWERKTWEDLNLVGSTYKPDSGSISVSPINETQFGEVLTAERTPVIELNSSTGLSAIRDVQTVSGSGAISASTTGELLLSSGATATSVARLDSASRIRYMPGYASEVGIGIRIPTLPTGNQEVKWGLRNSGATEGLYFGVDATGFYTAILRNSVETKTYQSDFNVDKFDGTGSSGLTLDLSSGTIFHIDYTWYGYGQIGYDIVSISGNKQRPRTAHQVKVDGTTSLQSPNLPIFVEVDNGGDASDISVYVGGRQACIFGKYTPVYRTTSQDRASVSTTTTTKPLISFRHKTAFSDRGVEIGSAFASAATENHIVEFYLAPTLTGASWITPTNATAAETALEVDISATAMSGGTLVYSLFAEAGAANKEFTTGELIGFDIPENQILTMAARTVTGTGTVKSFLRMKEEW